MGIERDQFEDFLEGSQVDLATIMSRSFGDSIASYMDQSLTETEERIQQCVDLLTDGDARKIAFGIFLVHDMLARSALAAQQMLDDPERLSFVSELLGSDSGDTRDHFGGILAAAQIFGVSSHLLCATVLRAHRSIAERIRLERIFGDGPDSGFVLDLAQEIRRVDGNHDLGAAALAEALEPFLRERGIGIKESFIEWAEELEAGPLVGQWIAKEIRRRLGDT